VSHNLSEETLSSYFICKGESPLEDRNDQNDSQRSVSLTADAHKPAVMIWSIHQASPLHQADLECSMWIAELVRLRAPLGAYLSRPKAGA
jgi:hypothetical protein